MGMAKPKFSAIVVPIKLLVWTLGGCGLANPLEISGSTTTHHHSSKIIIRCSYSGSVSSNISK